MGLREVPWGQGPSCAFMEHTAQPREQGWLGAARFPRLWDDMSAGTPACSSTEQGLPLKLLVHQESLLPGVGARFVPAPTPVFLALWPQLRDKYPPGIYDPQCLVQLALNAGKDI